MQFSNLANGIGTVTHFPRGIDECAPAVALRLKPAFEYGKHIQDAFLRRIRFVALAPEPFHPAHITCVQGRSRHFVFVGEVAINTFPGHT